MTPPPVPPPPPWTTAPGYRPPSYKAPKSGGKGTGCVLGVLLLLAFPLLSKACDALSSGMSGPGSTSAESGPSSCPERIASSLPGGDGAALVKAFRTKNKSITLCRTEDDKLFYYGEFTDHREPGIAMPATKSSGGYEAHNGPYRYRIHGGSVTIYQSGRRIGQEKLTPVSSPS